MSEADRTLWDKKWTEMDKAPQVNGVLLRNRAQLGHGIAIDVACGQGQNSIWLAQNGFKVLGVDLSPVALAQAQRAARVAGVQEKVTFVQVDLDRWRPARESLDLLCVMRFLDRKLIPDLRRAVRSGGIVAYATRHVGVLERRPEANPDYLLQPGELLDLFSGWDVIEHLEGEENASLVARKSTRYQTGG